MTHVATLVCDPRRPALDAGFVAAAARHLPHAGAPRWLAAGVAADILFRPRNAAEAKPVAALLRETCARAQIDSIVQPIAGRRKKLLVADMDSTVIEQECLDELADLAGLRELVAPLTARAMRGEIDFAPALRERVGFLAGLGVEAIDKVLAERISFTPGAATLVATMRAHGATTALVSGGFTQFAFPLAERLGFDTNEANRLIVEDGRLTGEIAEPVEGEGGKRNALVRLRAALGLAPSETLAVGDGANDIAMLAEAGLGVAFHAKPAVAAAAAARIDYADLTALLYAQGYRRDEFC